MRKTYSLEEQDKILRGVDNIIHDLFASFEKESEDRIASVAEALTAYYNEFYDDERQDDDYYRTQMQLLISDFVEAPAAPFFDKNHVEVKDKFVVQSIYNGLLQHFLRYKIEPNEGGSCIGDKIGFITRRLIRSIKEHKNLSLQPTMAVIPTRKYIRIERRMRWFSGHPSCLKTQTTLRSNSGTGILYIEYGVVL